jgi:RHH-type proline utilization regulon transcriptional repressor/proline dehydrogenase/delta 1-pyrroline-5-carboxylate dehydrogenase
MPSVIVMPQDAPQSKLDATRGYQQGMAGSEVVLFDRYTEDREALCRRLAERAGPIVGVVALEPGCHDIPLERLLVERAFSINTAAAGGNASLMTIG